MLDNVECEHDVEFLGLTREKLKNIALLDSWVSHSGQCHLFRTNVYSKCAPEAEALHYIEQEARTTPYI